MVSGPLSNLLSHPNALISRRFTRRGLKQGDFLRDRYRVIQVLSRGGWGETYVARDLDLPKTPRCVIKMLKPATDDQTSLDMAEDLFKKEANTLQELGQHEQIPRLLAYFKVNKNFYLVQEFVDGLPLSSEIISGLRWSESKVLTLLLEVLNILTFVHGRQVIHRDIKPGNIIRRRYDSRLSLIDFGAVKEIRDSDNITQTSAEPLTVSIGTKGYMPLEQFAGRPQFGSDIYALGIICAQALTGIEADELPRNNEDEILWQQYADVGEPLAKIINKMVRSHYRDRYRTVEEILADIEKAFPSRVQEYIASSQIETSQPSEDPFQAEDALITERYGKRKSPLLPAVGTGLLVLASVGLINNFQEIRYFRSYASLYASLNAGDWEAADRETFDLMLNIVGPKSKSKGVFDIGEWDKFVEARNSCKSIVRINNWWENASDGLLGFRPQAKIYREVSNSGEGEPGTAFYRKAGWMTADLSDYLVDFDHDESKGTVAYVEGRAPNFTDPIEGHLPALLYWEDGIERRFTAFYKCQLQT